MDTENQNGQKQKISGHTEMTLITVEQTKHFGYLQERGKGSYFLNSVPKITYLCSKLWSAFFKFQALTQAKPF